MMLSLFPISRLNTFLELKMENERLQQRLAELRVRTASPTVPPCKRERCWYTCDSLKSGLRTTTITAELCCRQLRGCQKKRSDLVKKVMLCSCLSAHNFYLFVQLREDLSIGHHILAMSFIYVLLPLNRSCQRPIPAPTFHSCLEAIH